MSQNQNPFGHPSWCTCNSCQEWREEQLDLQAADQAIDLLGKMKDMKLKYQRWTCTHCNRSVGGDRDSCPSCGSPRESNNSSTSSTSVFSKGTTLIISGGSFTLKTKKNFCGECGTPINSGARFCHECGTPV